MSITAAKRRSLKPSQFGLPGTDKFPLDTLGRARNAPARASESEHMGNITMAQMNTIDGRARVAIKRLKQAGKSKRG